MHRKSLAFCHFNLVLLAAAVFLPAFAYSESPSEILDASRTLGDPAAAKALLEKNLPLSAELQPYYLLELTRLSAASNDWTQALAWSNRQSPASIPAPIADEVAYWSGQALIRNAQEGKAVELYRKRLDTGLVTDPLLYLAYFRIASSDVEKTSARFDASFPTLKSTDPETFALSRYLGGIASVRSGEWNFAVLSFSRFSPGSDAKFPDLAPWSHYYLAYSLYRTGQWTKAAAEFTVYLDTWKNHAFSWQAATAACFSAIQAGSDALPFADRAVRLAPTMGDLAESVLLRSSILIDKARFGEAETQLSGIADGTATKGITPSSSRALFMLADIAVRQKNLPLAEQRWLSLVSRFPKDALAEESLYRSGEQWYLAGDWARASPLLARYRQAFPAGRFLDNVLWIGGDAYNRAGNADLAILWWQDLVKKYPKGPYTPRAFSELLAAYRKKGEYGPALANAKQYRTQFPTEAKLDEIDREIDELTRLSKGENPDSASLLSSYVQAKRAATAEGRSIGLRLARQYLADFSKRGDAEEILKEITAKAPRSPDSVSAQEKSVFAASWSLLGNMYRENADYKSASSALLAAGTWYAPIDGDRSAEALYGASDSFIQSGRLADAKSTVETLTKKWPDSPWARRAAILMTTLDME